MSLKSTSKMLKTNYDQLLNWTAQIIYKINNMALYAEKK